MDSIKNDIKKDMAKDITEYTKKDTAKDKGWSAEVSVCTLTDRRPAYRHGKNCSF